MYTPSLYYTLQRRQLDKTVIAETLNVQKPTVMVGSVVWWLGRRNCDQEIASLVPGRCIAGSLGQLSLQSLRGR